MHVVTGNVVRNITEVAHSMDLSVYLPYVDAIRDTIHHCYQVREHVCTLQKSPTSNPSWAAVSQTGTF